MINRRQFIQMLGRASWLLAAGCTPSEVGRTLIAAEQLSRGRVPGEVTAVLPSTGVAVLDSMVRRHLQSLARQMLKEWGDEKVPSQKEYVKYSDQYLSRSIINFESGEIRVETVAPDEPRAKLRSAIIATLLTPEDPSKVDLLSDRPVTVNGEPFLVDVVRDHQGQPVRRPEQADVFADHLLATAYRADTYHQRPRHFVTFAMIQEHHAGQQRRYQREVTLQARRFNLERALIYAIIEAESSFNPYAISHVPAYGLMQIVPESAGRDAHRLLYNRDGTPTRDYLFVPANNIKMGAAYLAILNDRYLAKVSDPQAREYCVIAGYNTGSGNVLKSFAADRERAFDKINRQSSRQVYDHLVRHLPYRETRDYLQKVVRLKPKYA